MSDLKWVFELTNLQDLSIHGIYCPGDSLEPLFSLSQLTFLALGGSHRHTVSDKMFLDCRWHCLQALQQLAINGHALAIGQSGIASLLRLRELTELNFETNTIEGSSNLAHFASLFYSFAVSRPEVDIHVNGTHPMVAVNKLELGDESDGDV